MKTGRVFSHTPWMALLIGGGLLLSPCASVSAVAQSRLEKAAEDDLKVAYTIAFLKFLFHPKGDARLDDPVMHICVIGNSSVVKAFAQVHGTKILLGKPKTLRIMTDPTRLSCMEQRRCWAVYIDRMSRHRIPKIATELRGRGVLILTESKGALDDGSMVNLLREGDRLRWEMSRTRIEAEKLGMSSQVYRNAVKVEWTRSVGE